MIRPFVQPANHTRQVNLPICYLSVRPFVQAAIMNHLVNPPLWFTANDCFTIRPFTLPIMTRLVTPLWFSTRPEMIV